MDEIDEYQEFLDRMAAIPYTEKNRPQNQETIIRGVCVNPILRDGFDSTANDDRDSKEVRDWWGNPFVVITEFTPEEKERFAEKYPLGKMYEVRSLTGGAWDRSSYIDETSSLDAAIEIAIAHRGSIYSGKCHVEFTEE